MLRTLVKTESIVAAGQLFPVRYFTTRTPRGHQRFSVEILLGPTDRIILDDDSVTSLQAKIARLAPATIYSRALASKTPSVAA